jgi:predicted dinucleotide-binding enzyme
MRIGVFGTGTVGQTIATKLVEVGHDVRMGSRAAHNEKAKAWVAAAGAKASEGAFSDAATFGEVLFNCTSGKASLAALQAAGAENMKGKILIDVANPLDFSRGMPPSLSVCNTDSLAEQIQRAFPNVKVVKSLNTVTARLMVNPGSVPGEHEIFVCGNDTEARASVAGFLKEWFGWRNVLDLGDVSAARGVEMYLVLWVRLMGVLGTPMFNVHFQR